MGIKGGLNQIKTEKSWEQLHSYIKNKNPKEKRDLGPTRKKQRSDSVHNHTSLKERGKIFHDFSDIGTSTGLQEKELGLIYQSFATRDTLLWE